MLFDQLKRREFLTLLGGAAAAWPLAAHGQQPAKLPTIGFVGSDSPDPYAVLLRAFRLGLKATGFIEGQNVAIEYRWAEGRNDKLPELTADLVRRQVAVIIDCGPQSRAAASCVARQH
jgi:putative tryptophan/tyrosine transport system substrate-binding protein